MACISSSNFLGFYLLIMVIVLIISSIIKSIITGPSIKRQIQIIDEKMDEIAAYYNQYENVMGETCPVPLERCHPFLIEQIIGMISSKRAESIKEAINLIIQDEHNQKIANLAEQQLLQLEQANYYLKAISKNTKRLQMILQLLNGIHFLIILNLQVKKLLSKVNKSFFILQNYLILIIKK